MNYLFSVNEKLNRFKNIVIYGAGDEQKHLFMALLQQNIPIYAFCAKRGQSIGASELFGKKVISIEDLQALESLAVVLWGAHSYDDLDVLNAAGVENIFVENISLENIGIAFE